MYLLILSLVPLLTGCPLEDEPPRPTGDALLVFTTKMPASDMPVAKIPVSIYFAEGFPSDYLVGSTDSLGVVTYDSVLTIKAPLWESDTDGKGKLLVKDYNNTNYIYYFNNGKKAKYGGFQVTSNQVRTFIIDLDR